ncbi:PREDICTED: centrosomal protein of 68 kDa [Crocodylus porosus]|uniref:centrosomal protein of 68 kDa n=1 Tax=Crocodylus porosus TaxID=8502 RepID=UPI00093C3D4F|nr:PREDICTED: centrosomal protein of 68 kDa [Crocodylus porosus]XP_019404715.1 PREDICTED: centrosomal protein of 68 kDa [Crocodylus porosus]
MALDVEKSTSEASLNVPCQYNGRWNCRELDTDYPELVSSMCQFLDAEEGKSSPEGTESAALDGSSSPVTGITQQNPGCSKEMSLLHSSRLPRAKVKANYVERWPLTARHICGTDLPHWVHATVPHSGGQQMHVVEYSGSEKKLSNTSELLPRLPNSAMDAKVSDLLHELSAKRRSQADLPVFSSALESLPDKTASSSETVSPRLSSSSLSTPPPEDSESERLEIKQASSLLAEKGLPPSEVFTSRHPRSQGSPMEDAALFMCSPLLKNHVAGEHSKKMSSFQADYWACAIPDCLPPSPDRQSPHWNPNKEYEDLLDYTYPLKPKYKLTNNPKSMFPNPFFHDSGVDLDSFSMSPESTSKSMRAQNQEQQTLESQSKEYLISAGRFSTPVSKKPGYFGSASSCEPSPISKVSFAKCASSTNKPDPSRSFANSLTSFKYVGLTSLNPVSANERSCWSPNNHFSQCNLKKKGASHFIPTTQVLPLKKEWENDEEYLSLPPRLKELEGLAQYLSALSIVVRKPGQDHVQQDLPCCSGSREKLSSDSVSPGSTDRKVEMEGMEDYSVLCHAQVSQKPYAENIKLCGQDSERLNTTSTIRTLLDGRYRGALESEWQHPKDQQKESLTQCIKIFCCQLEELIHWLYTVAEVTDNWIPPQPNAESVKTSLHRYLEFKKDIADHQTLTESVLRQGGILLRCMASNSPVLEDALSLLAKQSEELENHAERLYESVLAAMDTTESNNLTKDGSAQQTVVQAKESE